MKLSLRAHKPVLPRLLFVLPLAVPAPAALAQSGAKAAPAAKDAKESKAAAPTPLAYKFKEGQTHVYWVTIEADGPQLKETLDGPALYRVQAADDAFSLSFKTNLTARLKSKDASFDAAPNPALSGLLRAGLFRVGEAGTSENTIKVDAAGGVLRQSADAALPSTLGDLTRLLLEPLPSKAGSTWETSTESSLMALEGGKGEKVARVAMPSREKVTYTLLDSPGTSLVIKKQVELATRETAGGEPRFKLTGEGQTTFNPRLGVVKALEFKGTLAEAGANSVGKTLITVKCRLLEAAEREEALASIQSRRTAVAAVEEKPITNPDLIVLVAQLKANDKFARKGAADKLSEWIPNENRPQVARALATATNDNDLFVRWAAVKALGVWATEDTIPALIKKLDDPEHAVRWATLDALGPLKDKRAALPIALMVAQGRDRDFAAKALTTMGPVAEEVAIKLLGADAWEARTAACRMLLQWGSREAVPTLQLHLRDDNGIVRMAAKDALQAIGTRR